MTRQNSNQSVVMSAKLKSEKSVKIDTPKSVFSSRNHPNPLLCMSFAFSNFSSNLESMIYVLCFCTNLL